jgi:hypothetical protein
MYPMVRFSFTFHTIASAAPIPCDAPIAVILLLDQTEPVRREPTLGDKPLVCARRRVSSMAAG